MRYPISLALLAGLAAPVAAQNSLMIPDSGTADRICLFSAVDGSVIDLNWITDAGAVGWAFSTPKEAITVGDEVWISDQLEDTIHRFNKSSRAFIGSINTIAGGAVMDNLRGLGISGSTVYLVQGLGTGEKRIATYDFAGNPVSTFEIPNSSFDVEPFQGDLLVSDSITDRIERYTTSGTLLTPFASNVVFPEQIYTHTDGSIITISSIAASGIEGVYHFNPDGSLIRFIDTEPIEEQVPRGAVLLQNGSYLIATSVGVYRATPVVGGGVTFDLVQGGINAQHIGVLVESTTPPACYANCDASTIPPVLNVLDFNCFLNQFSSGAGYANCDGSTTAPVLNVLDFNCFLNRFSAGCTNP
jgi:hypothetical protein